MKKRINNTRTLSIGLACTLCILGCILTTIQWVFTSVSEALAQYEQRVYVAAEMQDVQEYILQDIRERKTELIELDNTYHQMLAISESGTIYLEQNGYESFDVWLDDYDGVIRIAIKEKEEHDGYYIPKKTTITMSEHLEPVSTTELYSSQDEYEYMKLVKSNMISSVLKVGIILLVIWSMIWSIWKVKKRNS